jgi:hypothetical protein
VGLWQEILIVAGSAIVGLLVGFLFVYLFFREKSKESRLWDKGADTIEMGNPKLSITTALSNGPTKLSGSEDALVSKKPDTDTPSHLPAVTEQKESTISGILEKKIASAETKQKESPKSDFTAELETNLAIASTPWTDKLISFQTKCWDVSHGEFEPMSAIHQQELIQLYVDIGLANNIVWMAREIGSRSKELDESYIKLCADIAANIKKILPPSNSLSR